MDQQMIETNGVQLCAQAFGDPAHPPVLLVMGTGASMLWWEDDFCRMLADRRRYVLRYDHRDTGRSTTYPPGHPGYTGADLVADTAAVLDGYGLTAAHVVGVSAGGAIAQLLALSDPDRVRSLVLISTTAATRGDHDRDLPSPTPEFTRFASTVEVDWTDPDSVVTYLVAYSRILAGGVRPFDESAMRRLVCRDIARARDYAAAQNHDLLSEGEITDDPVSSITAPTLVVHGTADPLFPIEHGEALAAEIPRARLRRLEGAGHGIDRTDWKRIVQAITEHTTRTRTPDRPPPPQR
jgi:pimeloyl-ACP methyl ester carboxylesterase